MFTSSLNVRVVLLAVLLGLSNHWFSTTLPASAAVISRNAQSTSSNASSGSAVHGQQQIIAGTPPSNAKYGKYGKHKSRYATLRGQSRRMHKVRAPQSQSNPFQLFINAALSHIQRSRSSGPKQHNKRTHKAIVIPNNHGSAYLLSHSRRGATTPQWISNPGFDPANNSSSASASRSNGTTASSTNENGTTTVQSADGTQGGQAKGVPGVVHIQSHMYNATEDRTIASLYLTDINGTYVLNASDKNETQLYLVTAPSSSTRQPESSSSSYDTPVFLTIYNLSDSNVRYCATYDPGATKAEPMIMAPCMNGSENGGGSDDTAGDNQHASQVFLYNQTSGQVRPTWFMGQDDGTTDSRNSAQLASGPNGNSTSSVNSTSVDNSGTATSSLSSALPSGSSSTLNSRDNANGSGSPPPNIQNVTLIFVPSQRVASADISEADNSTSTISPLSASFTFSSTSSSVANATATSFGAADYSSVLSTTTMTQTVTVFASASGSASVSSGTATPSGLDVEMVGGNPSGMPFSSPSASASSETVSATSSGGNTISMMDVVQPTTSVSSTTTASSSSVDASAIAASIAASVSSSMVASNSAASTSSLAVASTSTSMAAAAEVSPSGAPSPSVSGGSSSTVSTPVSSNTFVAAVIQRGVRPLLGAKFARVAEPEKTPVKTDPYKWKFQRDN